MERISGPRVASTPRPSGLRKRFHGSTTSFTEIALGLTSRVGNKPSSCNLAIESPTEIRAAAFASGIPVDLETNGTVRDARGFASSTYS